MSRARAAGPGRTVVLLNSHDETPSAFRAAKVWAAKR